VRVQAMITQADPQPGCGPIECHGYEKQFPGKEKKSCNGTGMENHKGDGREPIEALGFVRDDRFGCSQVWVRIILCRPKLGVIFACTVRLL